ncbi:hypothetical protein Tco_0969094 [Tanacetum coccineum]
MTTLKFADTHNLVAFLEKSTKSDGFEQIVDFLNAHTIKYALTVNPTIYISCIEQFWTTAKVKTVNGEVQLQALVDGKKIIITVSIVRRDLQLEDAEGVDCLPIATIFKQLTLMGFIQVFLDKQLEGMSNHKSIYISTSHTKKIFGNTRRVGKGLSGRVTPLFPTMMVQAQQEHGEGLAMPTDPQHTPTITQPLTSQPKKTQKPKKPKRKNTEVPQRSGSTDNVVDEAVYKELDNSLVRAATIASSFKVEQYSGNINKTRSKATLNEPNPRGIGSGSSPRCQENIGDIIAQTRFENVSKISNDLLLAGVNTPRSDEDSMKLKELMEFCTKLQQRVLDLENTKTAQAQEITSLKLRVKKLEKKGGSRTHKLKRLYKVGRSARVISSNEASLGDQEDASKQGRKIDDIDKDAEITLVDETQGRYGDDLMFDTGVLDDEEVFAGQDMAEKEINVAEKEVSTADPVTTAGEVVTTVSVEISTASPTETIADDLILAKSLIEIRSAKPKVKGVVIGEQSESTTRTRPQQLPSKDKGKAIMEEPKKPTKRKDQIRHDEEVAQRLQAQLQAELEEEDRLVRQREKEANIVSWDNVQAMIDADYQMAQQMQAEEQEKLSIEEKSKLFVQLLEARKKHFAAMRAQEKRNKPPTKAQKRKTMSTYLKNMAGYKHNQLKNKSFDDIQKLFDKAMKRVNTFVDMDTELVEGSEVRAEGSETRAEGSSKRAGEDLQQESTKKQKVDDDKETTELKRLMEVMPDEKEVALDAIPLAVKSPSIVDWKIHKEGKKSYYQIIRADGSSKMYLVFSHMLKSFDREDLETLYKLVKAKYGSTRPWRRILVLYGRF